MIDNENHELWREILKMFKVQCYKCKRELSLTDGFFCFGCNKFYCNEHRLSNRQIGCNNCICKSALELSKTYATAQ